MESFYDILTDSRYEDEKEVCERYGLFPNKEEWIGKILFIETCEEKPVPELFEREVLLLKEKGNFFLRILLFSFFLFLPENNPSKQKAL